MGKTEVLKSVKENERASAWPFLLADDWLGANALRKHPASLVLVDAGQGSPFRSLTWLHVSCGKIKLWYGKGSLVKPLRRLCLLLFRSPSGRTLARLVRAKTFLHPIQA